MTFQLLGFNMARPFTVEQVTITSKGCEKAYKNARCAKSQCCENVCASTDSSIKEDRESPSYRLHDLLATATQ